ncbi:MAG: hypothetical protein L0Z50_38040 [Verrucomicrobiales bacterium]|nr:hypothetical protein [Verrucomicrobiales bacterium]
MRRSIRLSNPRLKPSLIVLASALFLAQEAGAISTTIAFLQYLDAYSDGTFLDTVVTSDSSTGAPVSVTSGDLSIPADRNRPDAEIHVSIGSFRFRGDNPPPSFLDAGPNKLQFSGSFTDVITIPVEPGESGSVTIAARLDGIFDPDSLFAGYASAPSTWVGASLRAHGSTSGGAGSIGGPFAWDVSAVPHDEVDTLSPGATEKLVAGIDQSVDSGVRSAIFHYENASDLPGFFTLVLEAGFNAQVVGNGGMDFLNTFSTDVFLSENTSFSTESGDTSYIHGPASVPDTGTTLGLLAFAAGSLPFVRKQTLRRCL